jgi:cellulose synthase/poly-beta-1,6-N-acetylglucosamine synthase-like glycosyltransferase
MTLAVALFLLSAALVCYVVFGYPLLLALLARRRQRAVRKQFEPRTVTVLLPVRDSEAWVAAKLESILALDYPPALLQVVVVSDGSEDRTEDIIREYACRDSRIQLERIPASGKAAALNAGLAQARGEIVFFTDVRQPLERACLRNLVACFADPAVGAVSGELVILDSESRERASVSLYWRYEKWIRKQLSAIDSVPGATGAVYAMRRSLTTSLPPDTLCDDMYLPLAAFLRGYRVILEEAAVAYDYPVSLEVEFPRKVRTLAGVYQIIRYWPALLGPRNRMGWHFWSHKLGRLLLPFALLAIAVTSPALPAPYGALAAAVQAVFYALAAADGLVPESWTLKAVTAPLRTFVVLMLAALCAVGVFFLPARWFWKGRRPESEAV